MELGKDFGKKIKIDNGISQLTMGMKGEAVKNTNTNMNTNTTIDRHKYTIIL